MRAYVYADARMHKKCAAKVRLLCDISKQFRQKLLCTMIFSLFAWPFVKKGVSLHRFYAPFKTPSH